MKKKILIVTVLAMVVFGTLVGCGNNEPQTEQERVQKEQEAAKLNYSIEQLTPGQTYQVLDIRETYEYSTVSSRHNISLVLSDENGERYYISNDRWYGQEDFLDWATLCPFDHITVEVDTDGEYHLRLQ